MSNAHKRHKQGSGDDQVATIVMAQDDSTAWRRFVLRNAWTNDVHGIERVALRQQVRHGRVRSDVPFIRIGGD